MKTFSVKLDGKLVTVSLDALSKRAWEAQLGKLQHHKYRLEKKKHQTDLSSQKYAFEIASIDEQILALNSDEAKKILEEVEAKKQQDIIKRHIAQLNAEQIMLEFFGEEAHAKFMQEREFSFEAKDGKHYKINTEGTVFRMEEDENWKPICLIRPRELPLPDFIVAAITSVKNQPEVYQPQQRR